MSAAMTESFAELFESSQANLAKLKPGAIVTGVVVEVRTDVGDDGARLELGEIRLARFEQFGKRFGHCS